jgi:hypothetical protein
VFVRIIFFLIFKKLKHGPFYNKIQ